LRRSQSIIIDWCQFIFVVIATRYSTASFLGPLLILGANQALLSSIAVLPSGCDILYPTRGCVSCDAISVVLTV
jgi:hypothetical protein